MRHWWCLSVLTQLHKSANYPYNCITFYRSHFETSWMTLEAALLNRNIKFMHSSSPSLFSYWPRCFRVTSLFILMIQLASSLRSLSFPCSGCSECIFTATYSLFSLSLSSPFSLLSQALASHRAYLLTARIPTKVRASTRTVATSVKTKTIIS